MAAAKSKQEEMLINIKEALTNDEHGHEDKLQAIQLLKDIYKPPDKIFSNVRLDSLLPSARFALELKAPQEDFLFNYGTALADFIGKDATLDSELLSQLEYVVTELKQLDESRADTVGAMLWSCLEEKSIGNGALNVCKRYIEKMVLDWVDTTTSPPVSQFPASMAAASSQLFQSVTAILYEVLVRSRGHKRVFEVTESFISAVMSICGKEGKDFLGLYPKDCRRLVSLLMMGPEIFSEDRAVKVSQVNSLLSEMFLRDKHKALILLSHYSEWVPLFRQYVHETGVI